MILGVLLLSILGAAAVFACDNCPNTCVRCTTMAKGDDFLTRVAITEALLRLPETERKDLISHLFKNYKRARKAEEKSRFRSFIFYNIYQEALRTGRVCKVTFVTKNCGDTVMYVPEFALNARPAEASTARKPDFEKMPMGSYVMWTVDQYGNPTSDKRIFEITDRYYFVSL
jgi:hypothetical protein